MIIGITWNIDKMVLQIPKERKGEVSANQYYWVNTFAHVCELYYSEVCKIFYYLMLMVSQNKVL